LAQLIVQKLLVGGDPLYLKFRKKRKEWFIKYCSTDAGLQRYSGNVFTANNITNSVMTAESDRVGAKSWISLYFCS